MNSSPRRDRRTWILFAFPALGCSAAGSDATVGRVDGSGGGANHSGGPGTGGAVFSGDAGLAPRSLGADIAVNGMVVEIAVISCDGECADIEAVVKGGNPPFTYDWNLPELSGAGPHHICPAESTEYSVLVTDSPVIRGEFPRDSSSAEGRARIDVAACPTEDSGAPSMGLCVPNPSLEGAPPFVAPEWIGCGNTPDTRPFESLTLPASDGSTYLGLVAWGFPIEAVGTAPCAPIPAGAQVPFSVDLAVASALSSTRAPQTLQIWGGATSCSKDELLWTSPPIDNVDTWKTYCGVLTATKEHPYLVVTPAAAPINAYVVVDNFTPGDGCE